jgi:hypothetical protein
VRPFIAIFALLIAAVGWYYLFYSRAAARLETIEAENANRLRGILRRANGVVMLLMAVGIAAATFRFAPRGFKQEEALTWLAVIVLLLVSVILALIDVRLTWKLRQGLRERRNQP